MNIVRITDQTAPERSTVVSADTLAATVGHWMCADGALSTPSGNVSALVRAVRVGNWSAVHTLADHLSLSVDLVDATEDYDMFWQLREAAEILVDQADGWGLLGALGS